MPPGNITRRWRVPPTPAHDPDALSGAGILDEVPGALGLLLWQSFRDVARWSFVAPRERAELFAPGAERERMADLLTCGAGAALEAPLGTLAAMVGKPASARPDRIALACRQVAQWADAQGKLRTALAFTRAAAMVCPGDASISFAVGRTARRCADYATAEAWLRRTVPLARQSRDWTSYASAFIGLGTMFMQKGNFPVARKYYLRALGASRRRGVRNMEGAALHDLFLMAVETGNGGEARTYARGAFEAYGPKHQRLPALSHDIAYFWLTQGEFAHALSVFSAVLPHIDGQGERLFVLGTISRAAGGALDQNAFENSWKEAHVLIDKLGPGEHQPEALLNLARGAASLKDWDRAAEAANKAYDAARLRREGRIQLDAEAMMESVRVHRSVENRGTTNAEHSICLDDVVFADALVEVLNELAVPA